MKEENKTSREIGLRPNVHPAILVDEAKFNQLTEMYSICMQALTAAESDNERKDKEIGELKNWNQLHEQSFIEWRKSATKQIEELKRENKRLLELGVKDVKIQLAQEAEIKELKRENERLKDLSDKYEIHVKNQAEMLTKQHGILRIQSEQIQDLQSTIDRMKTDHASELDEAKSQIATLRSQMTFK